MLKRDQRRAKRSEPKAGDSVAHVAVDPLKPEGENSVDLMLDECISELGTLLSDVESEIGSVEEVEEDETEDRSGVRDFAPGKVLVHEGGKMGR